MNRYRLRSIERQLQASEPCDLCGSGQGPYEVEVFFHDDAGAPDAPEWCAACGRPTAVVLHWVEDEHSRPRPQQVWP